MGHKKTQEKFITEAIIIHGNKYDYSLLKYVGNKNKIKIICPIHGMFEQIPTNHLKGCGCYQCGMISMRKLQQKSLYDFLIEAQAIHGNKYDYSQVEYVNMNSPVIIICNTCGYVLHQTPSNHISAGKGCIKCVGNYKSTREEFILKAKCIHENKYDYSNVIYKNNHTPVELYCNRCHKTFSQNPADHINQKSGCPYCAGKNKTFKEVMYCAKEIHGDKYEYDESTFINMTTKMKIFCKNCQKWFLQSPSIHITRKHGCAICKVNSKGEEAVRNILSSYKIAFSEQQTIEGCRYKLPLHFDFLIMNNEKVIGAIEYNGRQHYIPSFGKNKTECEEQFKLTKNRDNSKYTFCEDKHIPLLILKYTNKNICFDIARFLHNIIKFS
jgi:hypothetical protein